MFTQLKSKTFGPPSTRKLFGSVISPAACRCCRSLRLLPPSGKSKSCMEPPPYAWQHEVRPFRGADMCLQYNAYHPCYRSQPHPEDSNYFTHNRVSSVESRRLKEILSFSSHLTDWGAPFDSPLWPRSPGPSTRILSREGES